LNPRALVIDDELQIQRLMRAMLKRAGWEVYVTGNGRQGLSEIARCRPDVVVLDLGLPDLPGLEVLKHLREWTDIPVLILSVLDRDTDKISALEAGADDFLVKPFAENELLARLRVLMRHQRRADRPPQVRFGDVLVDLAARQVMKGEKPVKLTETEFGLLSLLAVNQDRVLTQAQILRSLWGPNVGSQAQYLRVYINRLRQKLEDQPDRPQYLQTESGIGYRLSAHPIKNT
jgi:two-component system KDP operon response regulator KdpE